MMQAFSLLHRTCVVAGLIGLAAGPANAAQKASCSLLALADVRAIVGSPVSVNAPSSFGPTARSGVTTSNCTYLNGSRSARLTLMWGAGSLLVKTQQYYAKRHKEAPGLKGDVLVLASVTTATGAGLHYDIAAGDKLLAAALQKL